MGFAKSIGLRFQVRVDQLALLPDPAPVELDLVLACETLAEAMIMSWNLAPEGASQRRVSHSLGLLPQHFGSMIAGQKYLPNQLVGAYCRAVGNTLLRQWIDLQEDQLDRMIGRYREYAPGDAVFPGRGSHSLTQKASEATTISALS